jgi:hypothetical protein
VQIRAEPRTAPNEKKIRPELSILYQLDNLSPVEASREPEKETLIMLSKELPPQFLSLSMVEAPHQGVN